jgi:hypothetical protein
MKHSILPVTRGLKRTRTTFLWAALLCAALQASADTPTYYWDANGTDGGPGNPPDGLWAASTTNWTSDYEGNSPTFAYPVPTSCLPPPAALLTAFIGAILTITR